MRAVKVNGRDGRKNFNETDPQRTKIPPPPPTVSRVNAFRLHVCPVTYAADVTSPNLPVASLTPPRVAGAVCLLEALLLVVTAGRYGLELLAGEAFDANTASMSLVVSAIFAVLLLVVGMSWLRGRSWPRTPTIVWNVLLLPAAWTLARTTGLWFGLALAVVALAGVGASLLSPAHDVDDRAL